MSTCPDCGAPVLIEDESGGCEYCQEEEEEECPIGGCYETEYNPNSDWCKQCIEGEAGDRQRKERQER